VGGDLLALITVMGMERPLIVGHSWGGDVALEFAVANPDVAMGLCFVDGGTIEPSARHATVEHAKEQMAPPVFAGVTMQEFAGRIRDRRSSLSPEAHEIILANFEVLPDDTIRAWLSRDNHLRIVEALWEHHPPALYPQVKCPVLLMPARDESDLGAAERRSRRVESIVAVAELLPVSKTVWLEDSIHDVPIQRPQLVAGVIAQNIVDGFFTV
jgi:pimeloyl-ACP methyl ester carboxylesterase